jgi:hypothetical protein
MAAELFMPISPRHRRALEMLVEQKKRDSLGGIGIAALHDEDDVFTLEQITEPLMERGLIEDLTWTDLEAAGKYFVRITPLGDVCLAFGQMLREPRIVSDKAMKMLLQPPASANPHDPNEEREAIA